MRLKFTKIHGRFVLRLALDGRLRLSVYFVNHAKEDYRKRAIDYT